MNNVREEKKILVHSDARREDKYLKLRSEDTVFLQQQKCRVMHFLFSVQETRRLRI